MYSLGTSDSRPKWKDSGKAKLEKVAASEFARMSTPTLAQFAQLQSDLLTALRRIAVLEEDLRKTKERLELVAHAAECAYAGDPYVADRCERIESRLSALETETEDDASSVYVSDEDSGG